METYDPAEPLSLLIKQFDKGRKFGRAEGQTITDFMMVSKGITFLYQTDTFNKDIREWRRQTTNLKT